MDRFNDIICAPWEKKIPDHYAAFIGKRMSDIESSLYDPAAYPSTQKLFEQAFADKSITAWVLCNDIVGTEALSFLERKRISIPDNVSVISFDNTQQSLGAGITSYDFNMLAVIRLMIEHAIRPDRMRNQKEEESVEIEGMIIERASIASN